jgi:flagellar basal body P-ring protein FlgI
MTALIILEGQVMAVAEGEVVSEGIRIGKITPQELEVIMPDSTTRKFSLEGE